MWSTMWLGLWLCAVVFTICSFIWRRHLFFPLVAAVFWFSTGLSMSQLEIIQMGSVNIDIYTHELGDFSGEVGIMYLFNALGLLTLLYAFYNGFLLSKADLDDITSGKGVSMERL